MIYCVIDHWIHFFIEYLDSVAKHYPMKYVTTLKDFKIMDTDVIWVLQSISSSTFDDIYTIYPEKTYLVRFEQNSRDDQICLLNSYHKELKLIDYSLRNIELFPRNNYYYMPYMVNPDEILDLPKTKDIISIGFCKRRTDISDKLNATCLGNMFGKERDDILFRHKILINIHAFENRTVLEELRINRCIYNKMIVITEKSGNLDYYDLKDYIIECEYDNIVTVAKDVLENYDYYYNKLFANFDIIQLYKNRKDIADRVMTMFND